MTMRDECAFTYPPTVHADSTKVSSLGLTAAEYAAIALKVPDSGTDWLDAMILESRRMDAAQAALGGILAGHPDQIHKIADGAGLARDYGDAVLSVVGATAALGELLRLPAADEEAA